MADKTVTYRLAADISGFQARMAQASASVKKFAGEATAATKGGRGFREGLLDVGTTAGKVGLVAAAGLGAAVVAAANFDQAMSKVQAATHESASNMGLLREAAIQAGQETVFSASEAASAIEELAKAGVSTADILSGGLSGALDLAAAGSISVQQAAETASRAMTQFGLNGADVPHVADLLAAAAGKATGEVTDFGMALNQSGLVAAQMGVSIEETTGTLAAFASAGLQGSDAGTSFKSMLLRLANPSQEAAKTMERLGIAAYDAQGNFVGIEDLAGQLQTAFQGQSQAQRDAALATIFGSDAIRAANVLYNQGEAGITAWTNKVDDSGYAAETAATKLDNLKGDLEAFRGSLETALIGTGEGSQGPLRGLVQGLTDVVNAYNKLPAPAQGGIANILGLTALAGGGLFAMTRVVDAMGNVREAMSKIEAQSPRTAAALRGIGKGFSTVVVLEALSAVGESISDLIQNSDRAAPSLDRLARNLTNLGEAEALAGLKRDLGDLPAALDAVNSGTGNLLSTTQQFNDKVPFLGGVLKGITDVEDQLSGGNLQGLREGQALFANLDQALTDLGSSAGPGKAEKAFKQLATSYGITGEAQKRLMAQLPEFKALLEDSVPDPNELTSGFKGLKGNSIVDWLSGVESGSHKAAGGFDDLGGSMGAAAGKGRTLSDVLKDIQGLLDIRGARRNYQAAIDDLTKAIRRNGNTMDINTAKGRENQAALDEVASSAIQVAGHLKGVNKVRFMRQASGEIQEIANRLGLPKAATQQLIDKLKEAGRQHPKPKVEVNAGPALAGISAVQRGLAGLKDKWVTVYTNHVSTGSAGFGGRDPGDPHAQGGYITGPGTSTSDSIPARLSNGEYVVRAAAVQRYGTDFLHAVNAMRFAQGGFVGTPTVNVSPNVNATAAMSEAAMRALGQTIAPYVVSAIAQGFKGREQAALAGRRT